MRIKSGDYSGAPASRRLAAAASRRRPRYTTSAHLPRPPSAPFMRHDNFIHPGHGLRIRSRGVLPHWEVEDSTYFVTFRLRDSLPRGVAIMLKHDRECAIRQAKTAAQRVEVNRAFGDRLD